MCVGFPRKLLSRWHAKRFPKTRGPGFENPSYRDCTYQGPLTMQVMLISCQWAFGNSMLIRVSGLLEIVLK